MPIASKQAALTEKLRTLGRALVAYSGGVDSAYLAWAAHQALGEKMLAVIADSPSLARTHLADAIAFANEQGIPIEVVATSELDRPEYARNDSSRCFHCKDELFTVMEDLRQKREFDSIAYGVNLDDQGDFRPGQAAAKRHHVSAPLLDAGLTKQDIRELARTAGLRVWDKPASACLSSRIEYGRPWTARHSAPSNKGKTRFAHWVSANSGSAITERLYGSRLRERNCRAPSTRKWPGNSALSSKRWALNL